MAVRLKTVEGDYANSHIWPMTVTIENDSSHSVAEVKVLNDSVVAVMIKTVEGDDFTYNGQRW